MDWTLTDMVFTQQVGYDKLAVAANMMTSLNRLSGVGAG
jgi:hypothetical protein